MILCCRTISENTVKTSLARVIISHESYCHVKLNGEVRLAPVVVVSLSDIFTSRVMLLESLLCMMDCTVLRIVGREKNAG